MDRRDLELGMQSDEMKDLLFDIYKREEKYKRENDIKKSKKAQEGFKKLQEKADEEIKSLEWEQKHKIDPFNIAVDDARKIKKRLKIARKAAIPVIGTAAALGTYGILRHNKNKKKERK